MHGAMPLPHQPGAGLQAAAGAALTMAASQQLPRCRRRETALFLCLDRPTNGQFQQRPTLREGAESAGRTLPRIMALVRISVTDDHAGALALAGVPQGQGRRLRDHP